MTRRGVTPPSGAGTEETAEVLLQVILPIVLILTYCILQSARGYVKQVAELQKTVRQAVLEIQKQRLVAALEKVEAQRRGELGLAFFGRKEIRLAESGQLESDHPAFQAACRQTAGIFRSAESRAGEEAQLYRRVLREAKLTDPRPFGAMVSAADTPPAEEARRAQRGEITAANRAFLRGEIDKFLAAVQRATIDLELRVLDRALKHRRDEPLEELYQWNPEVAELKKNIIEANRQGRDPAPYVESLLRALYRQLRKDFERLDYSFLPEVWEDV